MRLLRLLPLLLCAVASAAQSPAQTSTQTVDRVIAEVNRQVITQQDLQQAELLAALMDGRPPNSVSLTRDALEKLIEATLLRQQVESAGYPMPAAAELGAEVARVRKQMAGDVPDQEWRRRLAEYDLTEEDFAARIGEQMQQLAFVAARFRPAIRISREEIADYYQNTFLPRFKARAPGAAPPPMASVSSKVRDILAAERTNQMLTAWLRSVRSQAVVRVLAVLPANQGRVSNGR